MTVNDTCCLIAAIILALPFAVVWIVASVLEEISEAIKK